MFDCHHRVFNTVEERDAAYEKVCNILDNKGSISVAEYLQCCGDDHSLRSVRVTENVVYKFDNKMRPILITSRKVEGRGYYDKIWSSNCFKKGYLSLIPGKPALWANEEPIQV